MSSFCPIPKDVLDWQSVWWLGSRLHFYLFGPNGISCIWNFAKSAFQCFHSILIFVCLILSLASMGWICWEMILSRCFMRFINWNYWVDSCFALPLIWTRPFFKHQKCALWLNWTSAIQSQEWAHQWLDCGKNTLSLLSIRARSIWKRSFSYPSWRKFW